MAHVYNYILIDTADEDEYDRYDAEEPGAAESALVDACVRSGMPAELIDPVWRMANTRNLKAGISVTVSGPQGMWCVVPEVGL